MRSCRDPELVWAYDVQIFQRVLLGESQNWPANNGVALVAFEKENALVILIRGNFNDVAHWAEAGIAMAGTATEQLVCLQSLSLQDSTYITKGPTKF